MSFEKAHDLVHLSTLMKTRRLGISIIDIQQEFDVSRRTAERMRDAVIQLAGSEIVNIDADGRKRWRIASRAAFEQLDGITTDDLSALKQAEKLMRKSNQTSHANNLQRLTAKIENTMDNAQARRLAPDLELLMESEGLVHRPGPRPTIDQSMVEAIRGAILASKRIKMVYQTRGTKRTTKLKVDPYGFLYGNRHYLVGFSVHSKAYRLYSLGEIEDIDLTDEFFLRDENFSLESFSSRAFGVFQEKKIHNVHLRFSKEAAADALEFFFHPSQTVKENEDGTVDVKFSASGLKEMCWHLVTWAGAVKVLAPKALQTAYQEHIRAPRI